MRGYGGGNPWQAAANAYGSDLDQYNQIAMQGMNERANAPSRLYQAFMQSYQAAQDRQMQHAEAERRAQMEQARIDHMNRADEFNRERLLAQDERADRDRSAKFYQEVDQDFTGTPEEVKSYIALANMIGIKGATEYFNSRKVAGTPARTENMAGEYPGEEGYTQDIPATPDRYMRGTQYGLKADAAVEANRKALAIERLRAEESARRASEDASRDRRFYDAMDRQDARQRKREANADARLSKRLSEPSPLKQIPSSMHKSIVSNDQTIKKIQDAITLLETNKSAVGPQHTGMVRSFGGGLGGVLLDKRDKAGVAVRQAIQEIANLQLHDLSGAAVTLSEDVRFRPVLAQINEDPEVGLIKLKRMLASAIGMNDGLRGMYSEENGYRPMTPGPKQPSEPLPAEKEPRVGGPSSRPDGSYNWRGKQIRVSGGKIVEVL